MEITAELRETLNETKGNLSGYKRRHFMAQVTETMLDVHGMPVSDEARVPILSKSILPSPNTPLRIGKRARSRKVKR